MNKYINRFFTLAGCALVMASCEENSWNDELDGFEVPDKNAETQTIDYTMTAVDYAQLAKLKTALAHAGDEHKNALAAVGSLGYFTDEISAEEYIPFFLDQPTFPYFSLNNGSAVKVTYLSMGELSDVVKGATNAKKYTVGEADYQSVWGSEEDYTEAFAPSKPASSNIPAILKAQYPDASEGDYVIVNYNEADTDPVFGGGDEQPEFELSNVLGSMAKGDAIEISGYVAAVSTQGPIVSDASGSVFVYRPTNNNDLKVGDQVTISSTVDSHNYGFQIKSGSTPEVAGKQDVAYPTPKTWTGAEIDKFVSDAMVSGASPITPVYSKFTGEVVVSGNYINIKIDGTTVQLSPYGASDEVKASFVNGQTVTFEGYVMAVASKGKYLNTIITKVGDKNFSTLAVMNSSMSSRAAVQVASTNVNTMYVFNGSDWTAPSDMTVLSHADYQAMGQSHDNLSGKTPETVLPIYLKNAYPYAAADDVKYVVYAYYNGSSTVTRCAECRYDGSEWVGGFNGAQMVTAQFVKKDNVWCYSPDVTITLPAGRNQALSTLYYQTCVDWIKGNVPDGEKYVTSYGNNEYYCGTSAYQGNLDLRPNKAVDQYPEGYAGMTDDEIVALEKKRFAEEVMPAALSILHPDAAPTASGIQPLYTINFYYYTGSATLPAQVIYKVVAPGTFEFVSVDWME